MASKKKLIALDDLLKYPIRIDHYDKVNGNKHFVFGVESVLEYAEYLPAVDAVEVVHGRWEVECKNRYKCSNCGTGRNTDTQIGWSYCPDCGAKMDLPRITKQTQAALEAIGRKVHKEENDVEEKPR